VRRLLFLLLTVMVVVAGVVLLATRRAMPAAAWIVPAATQGPHAAAPCPLLRNTFVLEETPIRGTVSVVGLGHHEVWLNGRRIGDALVGQPWSQYDRTLYRQRYDITPQLRAGENAWGILLGNSFWSVGPSNDPRRHLKLNAMPDFSAGHPFLLWLEATITLEGGRTVSVVSDGSWRWIDGPLVFSHVHGGEDWDARRLPAGWAEPGFDDRAWRPVTVVLPPPAAVEDFAGPPLVAAGVFKSERVDVAGDDTYTWAFPQNCSALLRFTVVGTAGQTIRLRPSEARGPDGRPTFRHTGRDAKEIWFDYTLGGNAPETHQTRFCYVGGQYVGVAGAVPAGVPNPRGLPTIVSLELVHVRAGCAEVGAFACSDALQNGAHRLVDWSLRSNLSYVVTDCPHREKLGWQEQVWHMARSASYRFDTHELLVKVTRDLRDAQLPDGHIPTNCPRYLVGVGPHESFNEAPEWGIAGVLVPWHLYEWYGDVDALRANFDSMRRYVDYLTARARDGSLESPFGDWYDWGHPYKRGPSWWTSPEVTATAVWALGARTVASAAEVLGRSADAAAYSALHATIAVGFQRRFYDAATKMVRNRGSCQGAHSLALAAGLIPDADRRAVVQAIVDDLERRAWQQTVGEVTQVFLIRALAEHGRGDVLHRVFARRELASYGHLVDQGFTTLPESWEAAPGSTHSLNHLMFGHLVEWHYAYVGGIRQQPGSVGWRNILIAPDPGPLASGKVSFASPAGRVSVSWRHVEGSVAITATIPESVEARAQLPGGEIRALEAGTNHWEVPLR